MPSANQKRMIKHIHETVFILLHDYHFDEIQGYEPDNDY